MSNVAILKKQGLAGLSFSLEDAQVRKQYTEFITEALELCGWSSAVRGKSVLIKPNLVRTFEGKPGNTTDPRVLYGLVETLKTQGASSVTIGENPGCGVSSRRGFEDSGCQQVSELTGALLCPFDVEPHRNVTLDNGVLLKEARVPSALLDTDLLINVPKMKTHLHAGVSLGLKNLHGILLDGDRYYYHRVDVHQKMVDLLKIRTPDLTVVDGVLAMEGQSPFFGSEREMDLVVAGEDPVAVDSITAWIMGFEPDEIGMIRLASAQGLGVMDLERIRCLGTDRTDVRTVFRRGVISSAGVYPGIDVVELGACDGCLSSVRHSLDRLQYEGLVEQVAPLTVVVGSPCKYAPALLERQGASDRCWFVGDCSVGLVYELGARRARGRLVPGCPPHSFDLFNDLYKELRLRRSSD